MTPATEVRNVAASAAPATSNAEAECEQDRREDRTAADAVHTADHANQQSEDEHEALRRFRTVTPNGPVCASRDEPRAEREQHQRDHDQEGARPGEELDANHRTQDHTGQRAQSERLCQPAAERAGTPVANQAAGGRDDVVEQVRPCHGRAGDVQDRHLHREEEHGAGNAGGRCYDSDCEREDAALGDLHPASLDHHHCWCGTVARLHQAGLRRVDTLLLWRTTRCRSFRSAHPSRFVIATVV